MITIASAYIQKGNNVLVVKSERGLYKFEMPAVKVVNEPINDLTNQLKELYGYKIKVNDRLYEIKNNLPNTHRLYPGEIGSLQVYDCEILKVYNLKSVRTFWLNKEILFRSTRIRPSLKEAIAIKRGKGSLDTLV